MTREELFTTFPRPWRLHEEDVGVVLCADSSEAVSVDTTGHRAEDDAIGLAEVVLDLVNGDREARQDRVAEWCAAAFGKDQATSIPQRALRLLEETVEAYQAAGGDRAMAHKLIDFIFDRPAGKLADELGAVGLTLLLLSDAEGESADRTEQREIARVMAKPLGDWAKRNQAKNDAGFYALTSDAPPEVFSLLISPSHRRAFPAAPTSVPWAFVARHEAQAQRNHGQTLIQLWRRGGLSWCELTAVLEDRAWHHMMNSEAIAKIETLLASWQAA